MKVNQLCTKSACTGSLVSLEMEQFTTWDNRLHGKPDFLSWPGGGGLFGRPPLGVPVRGAGRGGR